MSAAGELRLDVGWGELSALTWRNPDGPRALCLHGWMDNAASFAPLASLLENLDLVALDLAGHGLSDHRPVGAHYYLAEYVYDLDAVLEALGWEDCIIIGHSLGAGVGGIFTDAAPGRVNKLVMLDAVGPVTESDEVALQRIRKSLKSVRQPRRHERVYTTIEEAARVRKGNTPMTIESARLLVERGLQNTGGGYQYRTDARLMWTSPILLTEGQSINFLRGISCPVLAVLTPVLEKYIGARVLDERVTAIPNVQRVDIDGGHHVHLDDPAVVAPHLKEFLVEDGGRT